MCPDFEPRSHLRKSSNRASARACPCLGPGRSSRKLSGLHRVSSLSLQQAFAQLQGLRGNSCDPEILFAAPRRTSSFVVTAFTLITLQRWLMLAPPQRRTSKQRWSFASYAMCIDLAPELMPLSAAVRRAETRKTSAQQSWSARKVLTDSSSMMLSTMITLS